MNSLFSCEGVWLIAIGIACILHVFAWLGFPYTPDGAWWFGGRKNWQAMKVNKP